MLKKIFCILILSVFTSFNCAYAKENNKTDLYKSIIKRDKMIVGISFDSKPFGFKDSDGKIKGMEIDLIKEITKRIFGNENKVVFKNVSTQDRLKEASSGDVDMVISTITITSQRKKLVDFSIPYFISGQAIGVRKNSKINSPDDLINKKIIVELGTTGEKNIKHFAPNALILGYDNNTDAMEAFKSGEGDAITTDDALLRGLVIADDNYIILPKKLTKEPYGIAFRKAQQTKSLKNKINEIIKEMNSDGTLMSIKNKWDIN